MPTLRLQKRALAKRLSEINAESYKPRNRVTFKEFCKLWERDVQPSFKPAGQATTKSNIKILNKWFANVEMSAISNEMIQRWISQRTEYSPKTIANYVTMLQRIWKKAKKWKYVSGDSPFEDLSLPKPELRQHASPTLEQIQEIITRAPEPYQTMFLLCAETGVRGGELCGLFSEDIDLDSKMIHVKRSAFQGRLQTPKTTNAVRVFPISAALAEHIRKYTENVQNPGEPKRGGARYGVASSGELLFRSPRGGCYDNGNVVKRGLKPILRAMGIDRKGLGLHIFRYASATAMDAMNAPLSVRTARLGHASMKTTMRYTHAVSEDQRRVADDLGALYKPVRRSQ